MTTFVKSTITAAVAALLLTCGNFGADARRAHRHIHPVPCRTVIISAVPPVTVRVHNHFNREERLQEKHIVTTIKTDPGRGFRMLMGRYEEPVYWHIRRLVVSHDDAEDAAQETFIRVFRSIGQFRKGSSLRQLAQNLDLQNRHERGAADTGTPPSGTGTAGHPRLRSQFPAGGQICGLQRPGSRQAPEGDTHSPRQPAASLQPALL